MPIQDHLIHPALLDPRQWSAVDLYDTTLKVEREALPGDEQFTPARPFAVQHLRLDLRFDDEAETVSGSAFVTFKPMDDDFVSLTLDAAEFDVRSVTLVRHETTDHSYELSRACTYETFPEKLAIELPQSYTRHDQLTIEIAYTCQPRKGLYFIKPDESYPNKPHQIWSQGQNDDAHWWFPCHDVTNQKMTTELIAEVREDFFALSNGKLLSVTENKTAHTKTFHWSQEQPHPSYLVTIVIGEYEKLSAQQGALPVDYYVYRDRKEAGHTLFARTPEMIALLEQRFGVPYPYDKYAQILVDDFLFGAMENTSASTFTDRCLLDERAALDVNYEDIVAHELAHHWFGDLVTCKDWTQIWVNESFATYSEYLWREATRGTDDARFALFQDFLLYLREDLTGHRRPLLFNRYRFSEELMDRHAYEKGACVLDMLRWVLGDEAFFRSLQLYLTQHAHGTGDDYVLRAAIEEATGQNLHWFFNNWVYGAGYPELNVRYEWQRAEQLVKLSVEQAQTEDNIFKFPVVIEIVTEDSDGNPSRASYRVWLEQQEQDFYLPCATKPRMVVFDKGHRLFKLMSFAKGSQELLYQLKYDEDLLGRMRAACELAEFKSAQVVNALQRKLNSDDHVGVKLTAALSLGEIGDDAARTALLKALPANPLPAVRRAAAVALGEFHDEESLSALRHALTHDESYFVQVACLRALAKRGGDAAFDALSQALSLASWQEVVASAALHGWAQAKEKRAVDHALKHSVYGEPVPLRLAAIACLGTLGKELHKEQMGEKVTDHLIELLKDRNIRARVTAIRALGKVGDPRALSALREAQTRECLDQLKAALLDAIAGLEKKL